MILLLLLWLLFICRNFCYVLETKHWINTLWLTLHHRDVVEENVVCCVFLVLRRVVRGEARGLTLPSQSSPQPVGVVMVGSGDVGRFRLCHEAADLVRRSVVPEGVQVGRSCLGANHPVGIYNREEAATRQTFDFWLRLPYIPAPVDLPEN